MLSTSPNIERQATEYTTTFFGFPFKRIQYNQVSCCKPVPRISPKPVGIGGSQGDMRIIVALFFFPFWIHCITIGRDREGAIVHLAEETQKRQRLVQGKGTKDGTGVSTQISNPISRALPPSTQSFPISYHKRRRRKSSCLLSLYKTEETKMTHLGLTQNKLESGIS